MSGLLRELDGVRRLTDALRAQQHEFSNRLHAVTGLLELGQVDEALRYLAELNGGAAEFADSLRARIGSPLIIGLLLGKAAEASERGLGFEITDDTWLSESTPTAAGADDHPRQPDRQRLRGAGRRRRTSAASWSTIVDDDGAVSIRVADNGPGIRPATQQLIYRDGYTTKPDRGHAATRARPRPRAPAGPTAARDDRPSPRGPHPVFEVRLPAAARDRRRPRGQPAIDDRTARSGRSSSTTTTGSRPCTPPTSRRSTASTSSARRTRQPRRSAPSPNSIPTLC